MEVKIKLFAMLQEQLGSEIRVTVPSKVTPTQIKHVISTTYPNVQQVMSTARIAINQTFAADDEAYQLTAADEVAIIPPVSGG